MQVRALFLCFLLLVFATVGAAPVSSQIVQRYKQMLEQNPVEGTALDRLWKMSQENSETGALLDEYKAASGTFSGAMIHGHLLQKAGRTEEACRAYEHAAALDEKRALPHLALARLFSGQQRPKEAAGELEKSVALLPPDDPALTDTLLKLGDAWLAANDPARAAVAWEKTVARDAGNLALRQRLAENYEKNGLPEKAIAHYEAIEEHGDAAQQVKALQNLARIHQSRGEQDSAIKSLDKALALVAPGNWMRGELQARLIRLHQRYHRTGELEERWKKAVEQNPRDLAGYLQLIDLYERLADLDQQRVWLEKLCDLAPKNADCKIKLARVLVQLNQPDRAADLFDRILKEQPANADLVFARAEIDVQRESPQSARARVEALLEASKSDEMVQAKSLAFFEKHRLFEAVEQQLKSNAASDDGLLALARFYFSQRKHGDARNTLQRLVRRSDPAEKQSAAFVKIAQTLKEEGDGAGALDAMQRAVELQPDSADCRLALADSLLAANLYDDAQKAAEEAWRLSADQNARIAADRKTFETFQMRAANQPPPSKTTHLSLSVDVADSKTTLLSSKERIELLSGALARKEVAKHPPLPAYISTLAEGAEDNPSCDAFLRVARWHSWNQNYKAALQYCKRALDLDPVSVSALEFAVKMASADHRKPEAIEHLRKLAALDPAKKQTCFREIGRLAASEGNFDEALQILIGLEKENPGDIETLTGLAIVQQQASHWEDALATWQRAYDAASVAKKREIAQPLLNALERLGQHQRAAGLLLAATEAQPDENSRLNTFQDLAKYCARHELVAWLQQQYEQRRKLHPDDYFAAVAYAKILKANGQDTESFTVLSETVYSAPNEAQALKELVHEAEQLGDFDAAIRHQQRLILFAAQSDSGELEKLATLQEGNFDIDGAGRTWEKTARLFPRDPVALNHAAEFFERRGAHDKARDILRRIRVLDPANFPALLSLANLARESGDPAEAISCCEQVLQNSPPPQSEEAFKFPALKPAVASRLRQTGFSVRTWAEAGRPNIETMRALSRFLGEETSAPPAGRDFRLEAIREIAQTLKSNGDPAPLRTWLARWENAPAPGEALWAFYYADAHDLAMNQLEAMIRSAPKDPRPKQALVWLGLQMGEYARLRDWILDEERSGEERDVLLVALEQWLNTNAEVNPRLLTELFNEKFNIRQLLWQAAVQLASHNHFSEATQLGWRVFNASTAQRAAYGVELARWHIHLGDPAGARRVLRGVIGETASSFDDPVYEALREYHQLLDEKERAPFVESVANAGSLPPLHSAISLVLLYGLEGDEKSAQTEVTRLLGLRAVVIRSEEDAGDSAASRYWNFVLTAGMQLEKWKLDSLARFLWEHTLEDEAAIKLQGDQAARLAREVRFRLFANRIAGADALETEFLLDEFAVTMPAESLQALASVLESNRLYAQTVQTIQRLWLREPKNPHHLRTLVNACRAANEYETATAALGQAVFGGMPEGDPAVYRESVAALVDLHFQKSRWAEAKQVLDTALAVAPNEVPFLERVAGIHEHNRQWDRAVEVYRRLLDGDPANGQRRLALASALDSDGKTNVAIEVLENAKGSRNRDTDEALAKFYQKTGQPDKAQSMAVQILLAGNYNAVARLAPRFAGDGRQKFALRLMQEAITKCSEPRARFDLQRRLLDLLPKGDESLRVRETKQLRALAEASPDLLATYFDLSVQQAKKSHGDVEKELTAEWRDGTGPAIAGARLIEWYLDAKQQDKLRTAFATFIAAPEIEPGICDKLSRRLKKEGHVDLALQLSELLCQKYPLMENLHLDRARSLAAMGRQREADSVLEMLALRSLFNDEIAGLVAQTYLDIGNIPAAKRTFEMALKSDSNARHPNVHLAYARLLRSQDDWRGAKRVLIAAFRNPSNRDVGEIVEAYAGSENLDKLENEIGAFRLSAELVHKLHLALFEHYARTGDATGSLAAADRHPGLIMREATVRSDLRVMASRAGDFSEVAALFEKVFAQSEHKDAPVALDLALLYNDWAAKEFASLKSESALEHLQRANELAPVHLEIAQKLSDLYLARNQRSRAAEVLRNVISRSPDQPDREEAQRSLAKISAGI